MSFLAKPKKNLFPDIFCDQLGVWLVSSKPFQIRPSKNDVIEKNKPKIDQIIDFLRPQKLREGKWKNHIKTYFQVLFFKSYSNLSIDW